MLDTADRAVGTGDLGSHVGIIVSAGQSKNAGHDDIVVANGRLATAKGNNFTDFFKQSLRALTVDTNTHGGLEEIGMDIGVEAHVGEIVRHIETIFTDATNSHLMEGTGTGVPCENT